MSKDIAMTMSKDIAMAIELRSQGLVETNPGALACSSSSDEEDIEGYQEKGDMRRSRNSTLTIRFNNEANTSYNEGQRKRNAEFPKLTDQHILNAFIDSGVSNKHVHQLGILLGLSQDAMYTIEDLNCGGPAVFALKTVNAWLKKDPLMIGDNIQETFVELENKLRQVHLNCVIGKLRQKETQSVAPRLTDIVGKLTANITKHDAIRFGEKIGLPMSSIQEVIQENGSTSRGPYVALALYKEAERRHTFIDHSFVSRVQSVLMNEVSNVDDNEIMSIHDKFKDLLEDSLLQSQHRIVQSDFFPTLVTLPIRKKVTINKDKPNNTTKLKMLKGLIGFVSTILLLTLGLIIISLLLPKIGNIPTQAIITGNTISYQLTSDRHWLSSIDLELVGQDRCTVEALSVVCDKVIENAIDYEETQFVSDYIYLTEGAMIMFKQNEVSSHVPIYYPRYIWIFDDLNKAEASTDDDFERMACLDPPKGVFCIRIDDENETGRLTVPSTSFYFVRCFRDHECSYVSNMTITNNTVHDFDATHFNSIDSTQIISGNGNGNLKIQKDNFHRQSSPICVLMRLTDCNLSVYHVFLSGKRAITFLIYSCVFGSLVFIILIFCLLAWMLYLRHARNKQSIDSLQ